MGYWLQWLICFNLTKAVKSDSEVEVLLALYIPDCKYLKSN